jgi:hypothetical protein
MAKKWRSASEGVDKLLNPKKYPKKIKKVKKRLKTEEPKTE